MWEKGSSLSGVGKLMKPDIFCPPPHHIQSIPPSPKGTPAAVHSLVFMLMNPDPFFPQNSKGSKNMILTGGG
jgi:hypothetical protein